MFLKCNCSIMEGEESLQNFSAEMLVQDPNSKAALSLLPNFILFHGTEDRSIPCHARSVTSKEQCWHH